jgi:hypothetical protein
MKRLFPVAILVILSLLLLTQIGCDSDEETTSVDGPCGITVTRPLPGEVFLSGEEVKIFWSRSGSATQVKIDLLKSGVLVGGITTLEENDGYYFWDASVMEQANGPDYSIRVTALGESNCGDESQAFGITDVDGCNFDFETPPADEPVDLVAGDTYDITWFSTSTTGRVDLELVHDGELIGLIDTDVVDSNQSYTWNIDSLHEGTGSRYSVKISDVLVPSCNQASPYFNLVDENVCGIELSTPTAASELTIGDTETIRWMSQEVDGSLNIYLYYDSRRILTIAENVDPSENSLDWEIFISGELPEPNLVKYQIVIEDNNNLFAPCQGRTGLFLIEN